MRSLFKALLPVACLLAFTRVYAQEISQPKISNNPVAAIGLQTGVFKSVERPGFGGYYGNPVNHPIGMFLRFYAGSHFAVETGINLAASETDFTQSQFTYLGPTVYPYSRKVNVTTLEVPLQLQYYLAKPAKKLRPYFGAGTGFSSREYRIKENFIETMSGDIYGGMDRERGQSMFISFSQGISYRFSRRWVMNESVYYRLDNVKNDIGLGVGVGWLVY